MTRRKNPHISVKYCRDCGKQGACYDSRHGDAYIRRLYRCECGNKWSTVELLLGDNSNDPHKVKRFLKANGMRSAMLAEKVQRAISSLQELL